VNSALPRGSHLSKFPWQIGWSSHCLHDYSDYKTKETQVHRMYEQKGWIVWCLHLCMKFLKYDPSWRRIGDICHVQLDNNPNWGEGLRCT